MSLPRVSVIIPIYNVSKWIDRGINNILSQSLQDIEIWLVDDGSTDDSANKCKEWVKRDSRIHLIQKENGGAGSARNAGIDAASSKYIYFFDIDDLAHSTLLEYCANKMDALGVDYMMFGFNMIETYYSNHILVCDHKENIIHSNIELRNVFVDEMILCKGGNGFPWNKMYRRSFLNDNHLRFENQRIQQDEVFNLLVYEKLNHAYISSEVLYDYFIYNKGNTRSRFIPERFDIYVSVRNHFEQLIKYWNLDDERLKIYLNTRFYNGVSDVLRFNLFHPSCDWTLSRKRMEIQRIMSHPYSKLAFSSVEIPWIEGRLFKMAFVSQSIVAIQILNYLYSEIRKINNFIRKKI